MIIVTKITAERKIYFMAQNPVVTITMENGDIIKAELYPEIAPVSVNNFISLINKKFYDGLIFHRVIKGFMIQGGDPLTKDKSQESRWGTGGPGFQIKAEFNKRPHVRGVLSMARSSNPNSAGSQFFICHGDPRFLDGQYTAFGKLIKGDDVLEKIATTPTLPQDRPAKRMGIESVTIVARETVA